MLALQARGRRCVCLLDDAAARAHYESGTLGGFPNPPATDSNPPREGGPSRGPRAGQSPATSTRRPRHPDGLAFALHDLGHLEKFVAPEHHAGQVGFFRLVERALETPAMAALDRALDDPWRADRDYIIADMNGSAVFLLAALKMRLGPAARRCGVDAEAAVEVRLRAWCYFFAIGRLAW